MMVVPGRAARREPGRRVIGAAFPLLEFRRADFGRDAE